MKIQHPDYKHSRAASAFLAFLAAIPATLAADTFKHEDIREFPAAGVQRIVVDVGSADVEVTGTDSDKILVSARMSVRAGSQEKADEAFKRVIFTTTKASGTLLAEIRQNGESGFWSLFAKPGPSVKVSVSCPAAIDLTVDTGSGNVRVANVSGNLVLDTGSGNVRGDGLSGVIVADTGSGNVVLENTTGQIVADTGSGNVHASGSIEGFSADTGSGNVTIASAIPLAKDSTADTGSGNVAVTLPASAAFQLDAESSSGSIDCTFPIESSRADDSRLNAIIQSGSVRLVISTGSGDITVASQ